MHTVSAAHISSSEHQSVADAHKKLEEIALAAKGPGWRSALPSVRKDTEPCLQALQSAKARNWLGYDDDAAPPLFDIEMASHYARAANGNIRVIIPGKLILVPTPRALPKGRFWVDVDDGVLFRRGGDGGMAEAGRPRLTGLRCPFLTAVWEAAPPKLSLHQCCGEGRRRHPFVVLIEVEPAQFW